jgi:hypothetical protein
LTAIELAVAHEVMKWMAMMVALFADLPQGILELRAGKQGRAHSLTSIPS